MADEAKKEEKQPEERLPRLALLSGRGMSIVAMLLALELVGGLLVYFLGIRDSTELDLPGPVIIRREKMRTSVADAGLGVQKNVTLEFAVEVEPMDADAVEKELDAMDAVIRARVLEKIRSFPVNTLADNSTLEDLKSAMVEIHNTTLREYGTAADQEKWEKKPPIRRVWVENWQVN